jgi:hypothetical protein
MFGMRRREFITVLGAVAFWPLAARAADRPGVSSEMLRVECAGACDDKFATRDGPVWLYSASRLRARLACRGGNNARDRSYFNHPRYNSADHDRCPRCRQSLVRIYTQRNCTFATFEQCRAQVLGLGGWCQPNPFPDTAFGAHAKRPRPAAARAASRDLPSAPGRLRMADQIHAPKPTPSGSARLNTASA